MGKADKKDIVPLTKISYNNEIISMKDVFLLNNHYLIDFTLNLLMFHPDTIIFINSDNDKEGIKVEEGTYNSLDIRK